ncbi:MAG: CHAD domain-containing protein [Verrucomicrobiota bacterium]|nr:CHAD domain-containing protein [Verrucomicrobiota bacterium]
MPFRLEPHEPLAAGVARVAAEQIDRAIAEAQTSRRPLRERIHQVRTRCKKIRALLRLLRPYGEAMYKRENVWFRDRARPLSASRDADMMIENFDRIRQQMENQADRGLRRFCRRLLDHRAAQRSSRIERQLVRCFGQLRKRRGHFRSLHFKDDGGALLIDGLRRTYGRARKGLRLADGSASGACFHEWRKQVKYFRNQIRLLRSASPPLMNEIERLAAALSDLLGEDHDLGLLQQFLLTAAKNGRGTAIEVFLGLIDLQRTKKRAEAIDLGRRLFAEKPAEFGRQVAKWWKTAQLQTMDHG